jgi:hypothetical protein
MNISREQLRELIIRQVESVGDNDLIDLANCAGYKARIIDGHENYEEPFEINYNN